MTNAADARSQSGDSSDFTFWKDHSQISLSPVAAPSILGLYGFAAATFMVSANLAGWYGNPVTTPLILFPFAMAIGGIAQFLAGMWSYRARDAVATAAHGAWGSFWIAYGIYHIFIAVGILPGPATSTVAAVAFGYWFITLAAITWAAAFAAMAENFTIAAVLLTLAAGATILAIGLLTQVSAIETAGAIVLVASACIAWYAATSMMLQATYGRVILPMGKPSKETNVPGQIPQQRIQYESGEPGVKVGQ
ncbi:acetate uptake transporter family protein [Haloactinomyces albus]|uniref:Succinate-acetate transporter protein n=1 Tax=Haloactinomyces albus TaxID=1352928 RepID=A0AAE4CJP2_9ACTN|nr:GPR1/FUN34/YaaH family transporter [Haloactinomyces albus]MDR7300265.1 succinate-acetate transporter protein [Haloactinomyces albus]